MNQAGPSIAPLDPADKRAAVPIKKVCVRCRQRKSAIVLQTASFCHECFQFNFEGKVRQNLEQSRLCIYLHRKEASKESVHDDIGPLTSALYPCEGRIAIGFSGGVASRTLLHIAKARLLPAQHDLRNGKLQEVQTIHVIYIDTSAVITGTKDETEEVRSIVQQEGGEAEGIYFWPLKLQDVFDDEQIAECTADAASLRFLSTSSKQATSKEVALKSLFQSIQPIDTPKGALANARSRTEDLLSLFIFHLLRRQAIRLNATCLMTGETSTRVAIRLIEAIGKGRGHKVPVEEGSIRWNGLFTLHPMKAVSAKEVALYSRGKQLTSLLPLDLVAMQLLSSNSGQGGSFDAGNGNKASMARLTESLIHLLERNVASTVSTINKVGDKLVFSDDTASHGYEDDTFIVDDVTPFRKIGPSVPLRHRKRQDSASTQISRMSLTSSTVTTDAPTAGRAGDRSLQGLGLGRMGSTLYYAAKRMFPYNGALACPLCQMPSQRGLHAWKRGLTIKSTNEEEHVALHNDQINLTDLLCYACTIVLDTPESTKQEPMMGLPSFVLHGAQRRIKEARGEVALSQEEVQAAEALLNGSSSKDESTTLEDHAKRHHEKPTLQKLDREQMKEHLNGFLLHDEDSQASASLPSRERRQTDW